MTFVQRWSATFEKYEPTATQTQTASLLDHSCRENVKPVEDSSSDEDVDSDRHDDNRRGDDDSDEVFESGSTDLDKHLARLTR